MSAWIVNLGKVCLKAEATTLHFNHFEDGIHTENSKTSLIWVLCDIFTNYLNNTPSNQYKCGVFSDFFVHQSQNRSGGSSEEIESNSVPVKGILILTEFCQNNKAMIVYHGVTNSFISHEVQNTGQTSF